MYCRKCGKETESEGVCWECLAKECAEEQAQKAGSKQTEPNASSAHTYDIVTDKAPAAIKKETTGLNKAIISAVFGVVGLVASCYTVGFAEVLAYAIEKPTDVLLFFPIIAAFVIFLAVDAFVVLPASTVSLLTGIMSIRAYCINAERESLSTIVVGIVGTLFSTAALLILICPFIFAFA